MVWEWQSSAQKICLYLPDWASGDSSKAERWRGIMHPLSVRVWQVQSYKKLRRKLPAVTSRTGFVWMGLAREGAWRSPTFLHPLPYSSHAVLHSAWQMLAVRRSWAVISDAVDECWFTSLGDKSAFWPYVTSACGFLPIHVHAKQNYLHLNHWCFLECNHYQGVGPFSRHLNQSYGVA